MIKKFFLRLTISSIIIGSVLYSITNAIDVELHLSIVNSFSWTVSISWENSIKKNNIIYTNTISPTIQISSSAPGSYYISGDIIEDISWSLSQPYNVETSTTLKKENTLNYIYPYFWKGLEKLTHTPLEIYVDTIAPSKPVIIFPTQDSFINWESIFQWNDAIDNGVWIKEYTLFIATDSNFNSTIYFKTTTNNEQYINTTILPIWKLYVKVIAKDEFNNTSESETISFCNRITCTSTNTNWWLVWWRSQIIPPIKKSVETERVTIMDRLDLQNNTTSKDEPEIGIIWNMLYSKELLDSYKYAYWLWITTMPTAYKADLKWTLIRKDLAKMISEYAVRVLWKKTNNQLPCNFYDIKRESLETQFYIRLSCKLWLMGRHADWQSKLDNFMPYDEVNRAQFATVLSRALYWEENNIKSWENYQWYQKHLLALNQNKIMNQINAPWAQELRWRVMLTMMRADPFYQIMHASPTQ